MGGCDAHLSHSCSHRSRQTYVRYPVGRYGALGYGRTVTLATVLARVPEFPGVEVVTLHCAPIVTECVPAAITFGVTPVIVSRTRLEALLALVTVLDLTATPSTVMK